MATTTQLIPIRPPFRAVVFSALAWLAMPLAVAYSQDAPSSPATEKADVASGKKPEVAVLSVHDMLTDVTVESLKRRIAEAEARGADVIVLDMDTPGGLVTSSIAIADLMRELTNIKTVAWVNPNAHSGGSIVAVACDEIIMARSSRIGDSQVIMGGPGGAGAVPEELHAKAFTPVLADFRTSCRLHGYSQALCEAFVIPEREVWWIENKDTGERTFVFRDEKIKLVGGEEGKPSKTPAVADDEEPAEDGGDPPAAVDPPTEETRPDEPHEWRLVKTYYDPVIGADADAIQPVVRDDQLLEMSAGEASAYGFCKAILGNDSAVAARYGAVNLFRLDANWSELLAFWLTSMYVRGFLLLVIFLAAYVEFHTPGVGVAGLVALIALVIFVGAPYMTGLANIWEIVMILLGLVLLALEVFVIPGFGIAGISGIGFILLGLVATFVPDEPGRWFPLFTPDLQGTVEWLQRGLVTVVTAMAMSLVGMFLLSKYLPKTPVFQRIVPPNPTPSEVAVEDPYRGAARVGDLGMTHGPLRPAGKAVFENVLVDVVTQGEYLGADTKVEVIERRGNRVVVRAVT